MPVREQGVVIAPPGSTSSLDDGQVGWHAWVEREDGNCYLVDTSTHRATFLNDQRVSPSRAVRLRDGDVIAVARFRLVFRDGDTIVPDETMSSPVVVETLTDAGLSRPGLPTRRSLDAFHAVLEVNRALAAPGGIDERLDRALGRLMNVFAPAQSALVVTAERDGRLIVRALRRTAGTALERSFSRTILRQVVEKGEAVLISDAAREKPYDGVQSVAGLFGTAMCVPMLGHDGRPLGMIQLGGAGGRAGRFSSDDLQMLVALAVPLAAAVENDRLLGERVERSMAGNIQRGLLPRQRPGLTGYSFWECYRPAEFVGGDIYDYIRVNRDGEAGGDPRWVVCVGDVAGHGVPAALLSSALIPEIRHAVWAGAHPSEVLRKVNRAVCEGEFEGKFVTLLIAEVDPTTHRLTFANAGHERPMLRHAGDPFRRLDLPCSGLPLGVSSDVVYRSTSMTLGPGDVVLLHTDGRPDASIREGLRWLRRGRSRPRPRGRGGRVPGVGETLLEAVSEYEKAAPAVGRPDRRRVATPCDRTSIGGFVGCVKSTRTHHGFDKAAPPRTRPDGPRRRGRPVRAVLNDGLPLSQALAGSRRGSFFFSPGGASVVSPGVYPREFVNASHGTGTTAARTARRAVGEAV
ncbi:MAG: SpoIIE family protein phosphatase [Isosphaeraceae bacterium]